MRVREFVYLFLITAFSVVGVQATEFKSRYLKTTKEDLQKFYGKRYQRTEEKVKAEAEKVKAEKAKAEKPSLNTTFPRWSDFGKVVGRIDNYVIVKTKDGYLVKRDWRR